MSANDSRSADSLAVVHSPRYLRLLVFAALLGVAVFGGGILLSVGAPPRSAMDVRNATLGTRILHGVRMVACSRAGPGRSACGYGHCLPGGGPVFPAIFLGGAAGILFSQLPGLPTTAGIAMGMGSMAAVMLRMPMTAVLLASLLLGAAGVVAMPLVIVAVVVASVAAEWLQS